MLPYEHSRFFPQYARLYNAAASPASRVRSAGLVGNKYLANLVFSVRNLRYGPQTRLVRGIYFRTNSGERKQLIICSRLFYIETSGYWEASGVGMNLFRASKKLRNIGRIEHNDFRCHVTERQPIWSKVFLSVEFPNKQKEEHCEMYIWKNTLSEEPAFIKWRLCLNEHSRLGPKQRDHRKYTVRWASGKCLEE